MPLPSCQSPPWFTRHNLLLLHTHAILIVFRRKLQIQVELWTHHQSSYTKEAQHVVDRYIQLTWNFFLEIMRQKKILEVG